MPKFFVNKNQIDGNVIKIVADDAHHISRSLRMAVGEKITLTDNAAMEYNCTLEHFGEGYVLAKIDESHYSQAEPLVRVHLYQALPKGEKLDFIIQKSVECGAYDITPFESEHCIVKVKGDSEDRKTDRRNKIALEAAKQCGRGIIPKVHPTVSFKAMMESSFSSDAVLFCYEGEGTLPMGVALKELKASADIKDIAIIIGSEGGFSPAEAKLMEESGALMIGLGKRILRAETAAIMALSCLVYEFELN